MRSISANVNPALCGFVILMFNFLLAPVSVSVSFTAFCRDRCRWSTGWHPTGDRTGRCGAIDLSAAFDTVDHDVLFQRLQLNYGIDGMAWMWFCSYMSDRFQYVSQNWPIADVTDEMVFCRDLFLVRYYSCCTLPTLSSWSTPVHLCSDSSPSSVDAHIRRDHATPSTVVRDLDIHLDSDQHAFPSHTNCFTLLRYSEAATYIAFLVRCLGLPVSRCCVGADEAWLRKCHTGRYPVVPARSSSGGHECSGSTRLPVQSTRPHHSAALPSALASCAGANIVQTRRAGVPVCPWTGACLPGGRSTACRWTSWSTTPAFIVDLGTGCTTDTALQDRRPSVARCCSKSLEQSAIRSDVFKVSANI